MRNLLAGHAATSEFLRQFWQQVHPPADAAYAAPEERAQKARAMRATLEHTGARTAQRASAAEDALPGRGFAIVMEVTSATRAAVDKALALST